MTKRRSKTIVILTLMAVLLTAIFGYCLNFDKFKVSAAEIKADFPITSLPMEGGYKQVAYDFGNTGTNSLISYVPYTLDNQGFSALTAPSFTNSIGNYTPSLNFSKIQYNKNDYYSTTIVFNFCERFAIDLHELYFVFGVHCTDYFKFYFNNNDSNYFSFVLFKDDLSSTSSKSMKIMFVYNGDILFTSNYLDFYDGQHFAINLSFNAKVTSFSSESSHPKDYIYMSGLCASPFTADYAMLANMPNLLYFPDDAFSIMYGQGYEEGYKLGFDKGGGGIEGYNKGYGVGYEDGGGGYNKIFLDIIPSTLGAVGVFFKDILSFNVFGISMFGIVGTMGAILLALWIIKMVKGG